jgi:hypothetical protein
VQMNAHLFYQQPAAPHIYFSSRQFSMILKNGEIQYGLFLKHVIDG